MIEGKGFVEIADNAFRLAEDARVLFNVGRYPASLSLAILSLEEAGKYYMVSRATSKNDSKGKARLHIAKQHNASWFLAEAAILAFFEILFKHGYVHKPISEMSERQLAWLNSRDGQDFQVKLADQKWPDGIMDNVVAMLQADGIYRDYEAVMSGELNRLKQAGFYVDVASAPSKVLTHEKVKCEAEKWLRRAELMASRAVNDARGDSVDEAIATVPI